jgi:hypothetical protein
VIRKDEKDKIIKDNDSLNIAAKDLQVRRIVGNPVKTFSELLNEACN